MCDRKWLTLKQAAEYAQLHPVTLQRAARKGRLPAVKIAEGRLWRTRIDWVDWWLESGASDALQTQRRVP